MHSYLWNFEFDKLFLYEGGALILEEATLEELRWIDLLKGYYELKAQECRELIKKSGEQNMLETLPELFRYDVTLQLCLIYALTIQEGIIRESWQEVIESEAVTYFYEYRSFGERYEFERYSIMNQIAHS